MVQSRSFALVVLIVAASPTMAGTISFENATAMLAESCGKDIDANCLGVNLDAVRLKECLARNRDTVSPQCSVDYVKAFDAIQKRVAARAGVFKMCEREKQKLCADAQNKASDVLGCLLKVPRGLSAKCNQAISEAGYR
jgi:hypothetical protein